MANPNIISVTTIRGKTKLQNLTTSAASFLSNATNSGELLKINSLYASNIGTAPSDITVQISKSGTVYTIANLITVPTKSNLVLLTRDMQWYLEENDFIQALADLSSTVTLCCSYETIA